MKQSEFFGKFKSWYLWGNLLAMFMVVLAVGIGVRYGLDVYTHHGESIEIPNVKHRQFADAEQILKNAGLKIEVVDTGYVKSLPANCILEQSPAPGEKVKSGHVITVTINASHSPTITLPDVIDNSSLREAMAKLSAMGFKLGMPQYIAGEKDWVYGILVKGRHVVAGDRISVEETLIIQVGNGLRDGEDSVDYIDPVSSDYGDDEGDIDDFEEVPEAETSKGDSE
jgi:beta-lactam-binding protein with PASTA domain